VQTLEDRAVPTILTPVYSATFADARSDGNEFAVNGKHYWTITAGADNYQIDQYERPTVQSYKLRNLDGVELFATPEYFANLDIVEARAGVDDQHLFVSIKMAGLDRRTEDGARDIAGLVYGYGFRLATANDGGGGLLVVSDQPALKLGATFGSLGTFVYRDMNGDVGGAGLDVTKQDQLSEVGGNGYESVVVSDGRIGSTTVLRARIDPNDSTVVEFALNYSALGLTREQVENLPYLEFEANKGLRDPGNYAWNDEYTQSEAGSPYRAAFGDRTKSEFGTQGLGNIYELDTLRGGPVRPPDQGLASISGFVFLDENLDGAKQLTEFGFQGIRMLLMGTDDNGNAVSVTVMTDADGFYQFSNLQSGTYSIFQLDEPTESPNGFPLIDGFNYPGNLGGVSQEFSRGGPTNPPAIDGILNIRLDSGDDGVNYNFTELEDRPD
jgi:hypothetical protein